MKRSKHPGVLPGKSTLAILEKYGSQAADNLKALIEAGSDLIKEERWQRYRETVVEPLGNAIEHLLGIRDEERQLQAFIQLAELLTERVGQGFEFKIEPVGVQVRRSARAIHIYYGKPSLSDLKFRRDELIGAVGQFSLDLIDSGGPNVIPLRHLKEKFDKKWYSGREEPRRVAGGTETPATGELIGRRKALSNGDILDALAKRGVSAELCREVGAALTLGARVRTKWDVRAKHKELASLNAPQFLRAVYPDLIDESGRLTNEEAVRLSDPHLVRAVQIYVNIREKRGLDLGDAEGLSFTNKPKMGRPRKSPRKTHQRGPLA